MLQTYRLHVSKGETFQIRSWPIQGENCRILVNLFCKRQFHTKQNQQFLLINLIDFIFRDRRVYPSLFESILTIFTKCFQHAPTTMQIWEVKNGYSHEIIIFNLAHRKDILWEDRRPSLHKFFRLKYSRY